MSQSINAKISDKGCISVTGLQRFPVSLYVGQWATLAKAMPALLAFIEKNKADPRIVAAAESRKEKKVADGGANLL